VRDAISRRVAVADRIHRLVAAQVALATVMMLRLPAIYIDYDYRLWYYPIPFQALVLALMIVLAGRCVATRMQASVAAALVACAIGANIAAWSGRRDQHLHGQWWFRETVANTAALKASLAEGRLRSELPDEYRALALMWLRPRQSEDPR
jgi:hypothetical protein